MLLNYWFDISQQKLGAIYEGEIIIAPLSIDYQITLNRQSFKPKIFHFYHLPIHSQSLAQSPSYLLTSPQMKLFTHLKHHYFTTEIKHFPSKYLQDDYQILGFLGQGSTSRVFLGSNILTNQKVVIKIFKPIPQEKIHREIRVNNKINNYCQQWKGMNKSVPIVQLLDVVRNKGCGAYAFVFQYFPGSPMHMTSVNMIKQNRLKYMHQILTAIDIIHSVNLIHRDLKPSNILVTTQGAKLFDFGLTKQLHVDELKTNRFGTKCYYPPEVVFRMPEYDQKLDVWTCGLIFAELLTLIKPILLYKSDLETLNQVVNFCDYNEKEDRQVIKEDFRQMIQGKVHARSFEAIITNLRNSKNILPELSNQQLAVTIKLIKKMLKINPANRPTIQQVISQLNFINRKR